jgi:hypothetical protein
MTPEEGLRTHADLSGGSPSGTMLPIHWGTFNLAPHPWAEPAELTVQAARNAGARYAVPRPGQPFEPAGELPLDTWWRAVAVPPAGGPARQGAAAVAAGPVPTGAMATGAGTAPAGTAAGHASTAGTEAADADSTGPGSVTSAERSRS